MSVSVETKGQDSFLKVDGRLSFFARVANLGQGSYGLELEGYEDGQLSFFVSQKCWATSLLLETTVHFVEVVDGETRLCGEATSADPRLLMLHILAGRLMLMENWAGYNDNLAEKEINEVLPNPTIDEAREWLEKNYFTGANAWSKKGDGNKRQWNNAPGWFIGEDRDLVFLDPKVKALYDKYRKLWKEEEQKESE